MKSVFNNIKELYGELKANREQYLPLWKEIAKYVGIQVDPNINDTKQHSKSNKLDDLIDDPTAPLSVNQAGDYMQGVLWGTGEDILTLEPSDYVLEKTDTKSVNRYFQFATKRLLQQMNHPRSGLNASMKAYSYDQHAFGTSGIGVFKNQEFLANREDNALIFRSYGVDNLVIDEGKNGLIEIIFIPYNWRVNRIVEEFAMDENGEPNENYSNLPDKIKSAYENKNFNQSFTIIQGIYPRSDYDPKLKGKKGTKYVGSWFMEEEGDIFYSEDFKDLPISVCRAIKIRGEVYGRASGTMLISSIKTVNHIFGQCIEILEKMADQPLGTWNNALMGDSVLDTSPSSLVVFNGSVSDSGKPPVFPLADVGDPSGLINVILPYLNDKITTGFKVDVLLDFSDSTQRTATEMMQRFTIRGRSLSGMLLQQKVEMLFPTVKRSVSLLEDCGMMGVDSIDTERIQKLLKLGKDEMIIPEAVLECKAEGKPWFKIRFNNELEKLTRTEGLESIMQTVNGVGMIAQMFPQIIEGVEWFDMWQKINDLLGEDFAIDKKKFEEMIKQAKQMQNAQMMAVAGQAGSEVDKNLAMANKANAEASK